METHKNLCKTHKVCVRCKWTNKDTEDTFYTCKSCTMQYFCYECGDVCRECDYAFYCYQCKCTKHKKTRETVAERSLNDLVCYLDRLKIETATCDQCGGTGVFNDMPGCGKCDDRICKHCVYEHNCTNNGSAFNYFDE